MARVALVRVAGAERGSEAWVRGEATLGKPEKDPRHTLTIWTEDEEVALGAYDSFISRKHARLSFNGDRLLVQDLGSRNGTFLEGRQLPVGMPGKPGDAVPVTKLTAELRLGPRCVLEIIQQEAPKGAHAQAWGQASATMPYRHLRAPALWQWEAELERQLPSAVTLERVQEWFGRGNDLLALFPDLHKCLDDAVKRLDAHLFPGDLLDEEDKRPFAEFCRALPSKLQAQYLR